MKDKLHFQQSFLGSCPVCKKAFERRGARLVLKGKFKKLYSATCKECETSVLLLVSPVKDKILTTIGMVTDLTKDEVNLIKSKKGVSIDNVLEINDIINNLK